MAIVLNAFAGGSAFAAAFWGDSGSYDVGGHQLALKWSGEPITTAYMSRAVSGYRLGLLRRVDLLRPRPQPTLRPVSQRADRSGLTVLVIYAIAARLFDRAAARWAALFMAFFPQVVFWSTGMYKDSGRSSCASHWPCTRC